MPIYFNRVPTFFAMIAFLIWLSTGIVKADGFIETFDDARFREDWKIANFDQGDSFVTGWRRKLVSVRLAATPNHGGGELTMRLTPGKANQEKAFFGAQLHRSGNNHFGDYEVFMKAARGSGLVSAFFVYTGPFFEDPHDEIDFEILGRDTKKVWINAFSDGTDMPGEWIDLGADGSTKPLLYRMEWREDSITWYVDGQLIKKVTSDDIDIPQNDGKVYLSLWAGNKKQKEWLGPVTEDTEAQMSVYCVSYRPKRDPGLTCADYIIPKL